MCVWRGTIFTGLEMSGLRISLRLSTFYMRANWFYVKVLHNSGDDNGGLNGEIRRFQFV